MTMRSGRLRTSWRVVPLGQVLERIEAGTSFKAQDRPAVNGESGVLKVSAVTWGTFQPNENKALFPNCEPGVCPRVRKGDLLISRANTTELIAAIVMVEHDHPNLLLSDKTLRLVPSEAVYPKYLLYALRAPLARGHFERHATGTSASMRNISQENIADAKIPLPPLAEQRRIAAILGRADRLRRLRRFEVEAVETVLFAAFRKMFSSRFEQGPCFRFIDLVKITGGGTPSRGRPEYFRGRIPWLTSKDMRSDYIWDTEEHITEEGIENSCTNLVPVNSILLVVKSKILMHRLPVAITKVPICHGQDIKSIQCSAKLHHEFARFALKYHERRLLQVARGANTEGLTLPMLEELPVPKVDMREQERFASLVERVERLRSTHREGLRQAEHLFQALLHRAFTSGL